MKQSPADTLLTPVSESELAATLLIGARDASEPRAVDPAPRPLSGDRYAVQRQLGAGGMGEVLLCRDAWMGRDVAMKVMRASTEAGSEGRARFLREARVQGQLEHPSVVPVYDMAAGASGAPYFTMKRIQGLTLRDILDRLAQRDEAAAQAYGRRKLLAALSQACLALAFAHQRGVIHRDLKPDNLMLGEFGEVYVLDWGVARTVGAGDEPPASGATQELALADDTPATAVGALIGTPGYMAPEQARGEVALLSPRSDVYALGCLLFEILTLEPLHKAKELHALIASAITTVAPRPSDVAPGRDIPPELDAVCQRALALDPAERYATARELADALERFMDGERDQQLRKALADDHLSASRQALELAALGGDDAEEARTRGMRELGRALALDPSNETAMQLVTRVVMSAPNELPPAAEAALKQVELEDRAASAKRSLFAYALWIVFCPLLLWLGVKSWPLMIALDCAVLSVALYSMWMVSTGNVQPRFMRMSMFATFGLMSMLSSICGPLFVVPGAACLAAASFLVSVRPNELTRWALLTLTTLSILVPGLIEWSGLVPRSMLFEDGVIKIVPRLTHFPPAPTLVFLIVLAVVQVANAFLLIGPGVKGLVAAERKNFALAYRLGQLLPVAGPPRG